MMDMFSYLIRGLPWTFALTFLSLLFGSLLAIPLLLARLSVRRPVRWAAMALIMGVRGLPPIVWLFIIFYGLGSGYVQVPAFQAAIFGLSIISAAYLAEIYRGAYLSIHKGQFEAAAALNMNALRAWIDVIAPQLFRVALPSVATYAIGLLKDTAIASTIGVTELTFQGNQLSMATYKGFEVFSIVALIYIIISLPIAGLSRVLDANLRAKVSQ